MILGVVLLLIGAFLATQNTASRIAFPLIIVGAMLIIKPAFSRDDGRYANSPLKEWFDQLRSENGLCCSYADGRVVDDPDWETKDGHYRVKIDGEWIVVEDGAVIKEPNRAGRTMVWPYHSLQGGLLIRCFMPGTMG
jgi:hypothetical protein